MSYLANRLTALGLLDGLKRYVEGHIETGGFLRAVLENDLVAVTHRGTAANIEALPDIVCWLETHAPRECWGTPAKVKVWLAVCQNCSHPFSEHGPYGCRRTFAPTPSLHPAENQQTRCVCTRSVSP